MATLKIVTEYSLDDGDPIHHLHLVCDRCGHLSQDIDMRKYSLSNKLIILVFSCADCGSRYYRKIKTADSPYIFCVASDYWLSAKKQRQLLPMDWYTAPEILNLAKLSNMSGIAYSGFLNPVEFDIYNLYRHYLPLYHDLNESVKYILTNCKRFKDATDITAEQIDRVISSFKRMIQAEEKLRELTDKLPKKQYGVFAHILDDTDLAASSEILERLNQALADYQDHEQKQNILDIGHELVVELEKVDSKQLPLTLNATDDLRMLGLRLFMACSQKGHQALSELGQAWVAHYNKTYNPQEDLSDTHSTVY